MNEHFHNHLGLIEVTTKLGGVILRKAELDADFEKVYTKVFEKMVEVEFLGSEDFLEIFGEVSG